ncbi:MAG TPA: hypothetical protein VHW93_10130 [Acidimicrobiales bacterium]|nr:hypothetical protein [Acidimicrobiales bacterium]
MITTRYPDTAPSVTSSQAKCHEAPPDKLVTVNTDPYNFWPVVLPGRDLDP